jgi:hypothetical protein
VFSFIPRLPYPISLAGLIMGSWMILGVVYLVYLSIRDRDRIRATERVFLEEDPEELRAGEEGPALSPGSAAPVPMHADTEEPPPGSADPPPTPTDPTAPPS